MSKETELLNALLNDEPVEDFTPRSRMEAYLKNCCLACGCDGLPAPITETDKLLFALSEKMAGGGGGSGGGSTGDEEWFNDGDTHIWITLSEGRTSPMLGVCPNGTVTVDWGDGTEPDVLTGTSTVKWTPNHEYGAPGEYIIRLTVDGTANITGTSQGATILVNSSLNTDGRNNAYITAIKKIEIGNDLTIGAYAFYNCYSLASVVLPDGVTTIGAYAFYNCYSLASVVLPDSVTTISDRAFQACSSLASIVIPNGVNTIYNYLFTNAKSLRFCDFSSHTEVAILKNSGVFNNTPDDCEIRVPAALYDEWIAATNWSAYASKIVAV